MSSVAPSSRRVWNRTRQSEARGDGAPSAPHVVTIIEPVLEQVIGAEMLRRSLTRSSGAFSHSVCVVERERERTSAIVDCCAGLGMRIGVASPKHANPYLNKWLAFDAFGDLSREAHVVVMDWDMIVSTVPRPLPGPFDGRIGGRRNSPDLYRGLLKQAGRRIPRSSAVRWRRVRSSLNGGILIGSGSALSRCAEKPIAWVGYLSQAVPDAQAWMIEQLGLSIAVGEIGFVAIDPCWNATLQSPLSDEEICVWHYNDGDASTYRLKRSLCEPEEVERILAELRVRWPRNAGVFLDVYREVVVAPPLRERLTARSLGGSAS